jgi:hypothetical protein
MAAIRFGAPAKAVSEACFSVPLSGAVSRLDRKVAAQTEGEAAAALSTAAEEALASSLFNAPVPVPREASSDCQREEKLSVPDADDEETPSPLASAWSGSARPAPMVAARFMAWKGAVHAPKQAGAR